jgi:hypothetical protein
MMVEDGSLRRMGRVEEVLATVELFGDQALDFVWQHKGGLMVGAVIAAFLRDPAPFLGGTRDLGGNMGHRMAPALADGAGHLVQEAVWPLVWSAAGCALLALAFNVIRARKHAQSH